jgi:hypothetical protein
MIILFFPKILGRGIPTYMYGESNQGKIIEKKGLSNLTLLNPK